MKWTLVFILVLLILGLLYFPEETKAFVGYAIWGTKTLTGYAIKYGPDLINRTATLIG